MAQTNYTAYVTIEQIDCWEAATGINLRNVSTGSLPFLFSLLEQLIEAMDRAEAEGDDPLPARHAFAYVEHKIASRGY